MPYKNCSLPSYPQEMDMWDVISHDNRPKVVYGMGNGADKLISRLSEYNVEVADFFASDGFVRGHSFHGKRVKSFSEVKEEYEDFIILVSFGSSRDEVIELFEALDREYDLYIPDMPIADSQYFDRNFYNTSYPEILKAYNSLSDDESKNAFASIVNYKLTGKLSYLLGASSSKDEMYSFFSSVDIKSYIDAGAYNGDTLAEAIEYFPNLTSAIAIEPDPKNFKKLDKFVITLDTPTVTIHNAAVYDNCTDATFISSGNRNSSVSSTASFEHRTNDVTLVTVDSLVSGEVDYIKYDVEGAEYEALIGTDKTIRTHTPALLVSLYHRSRDVFSLVNYVADLYGGDYDLYMRRLYCLPAWELDLVAIPKKWKEK